MEDKRLGIKKGTAAGGSPPLSGALSMAELVERSAGGDYEAFGQIYAMQMARIYRYVLCQVQDKMTAEDITEDVFLKAWEAIKYLRGRDKTLLVWLYRIAHNKVADHHRRNNRFQPMSAVEVPDYRDPQERAETNLIHQSALSKVHGLPAEQRAVIVLKFVDGLENRDIGQVLGKSQGAIRILQMRGLSSIRKRMQREMDQHEPNVVGGTGRLFAANQQR